MASKPRVLNKYKMQPGETGLSVMRGTPWGNPFPIGEFGDRNDVCDAFDEWVEGQPELQQRAKRELRGHNLICVCDPLRCHAHTWLRIANED